MLASVQTCWIPFCPVIPHSMYGAYLNDEPNSSFCSSQCGHQNAPYIFACLAARHLAKASRRVFWRYQPMKTPIATRARMATITTALRDGLGSSRGWSFPRRSSRRFLRSSDIGKILYHDLQGGGQHVQR